jgi:hypothetical protein
LAFGIVVDVGVVLLSVELSGLQVLEVLDRPGAVAADVLAWGGAVDNLLLGEIKLLVVLDRNVSLEEGSG